MSRTASSRASARVSSARAGLQALLGLFQLVLVVDQAVLVALEPVGQALALRNGHRPTSAAGAARAR